MNLSKDLKKKKKKEINFFSKWIFITIFIFVVLMSYYLLTKDDDSLSVSETYNVSTGSLDIYVSAEGKLISGKRLELNFPVSGKIKEIFKSEGEDVIIDEQIAILDNSAYILSLNQANISLKNTYAILDDKKTINQSSVNVYKKDVDLAKISLDNTKLRSEIDIESANNNYSLLELKKETYLSDLTVEKANLELIKKDEDKKILNLENIVSLKVNILFLDISKYLGEVDILLGITPLNKDKNNKYEDYLSAKNTSYLKEVESLFLELNNSFEERDKLISDIYAQKLKNILSKTILVIENTIDSVVFTDAEISSKKLEFQNYLNAFEIVYQDYQITKQNLDYEIINKDILIEKQNNLIRSLISNLSLIEKDLSIAKQNMDDTKELSSKAIVLSEKQLERSEAEYIQRSSGLSTKELQPYYIAIEEAKNNLTQVKENMKDTILLSPVDGTILDINYKVGEYYGSRGESFAIVISSNSKYVESYIEERDIISIYVGQKVNISLDAFDDYSFTGEVVYVSDKGEKNENDVVSYKTLISFEEEGENMRDSMTASLDLLSQSIESDIVIIRDYVYYEEGVGKVMLSSGISVEVKEGISDGEYVQILEGLKVGDEIILK